MYKSLVSFIQIDLGTDLNSKGRYVLSQMWPHREGRREKQSANLQDRWKNNDVDSQVFRQPARRTSNQSAGKRSEGSLCGKFPKKICIPKISQV